MHHTLSSHSLHKGHADTRRRTMASKPRTSGAPANSRHAQPQNRKNIRKNIARSPLSPGPSACTRHKPAIHGRDWEPWPHVSSVSVPKLSAQNTNFLGCSHTRQDRGSIGSNHTGFRRLLFGLHHRLLHGRALCTRRARPVEERRQSQGFRRGPAPNAGLRGGKRGRGGGLGASRATSATGAHRCTSALGKRPGLAGPGRPNGEVRAP
mmetsp:Transcript_5736/g.16222  ORF Transcript_5736/g.16222 Transcript_5736/m.16222 type:complete len:208 (+) Transcript_5736:356-979(+)